MALFFCKPVQLQADYEAAIAQNEIVVTAEASVMPRNWIHRVEEIKRYMRCLALMGAGDTARFRELELEADRILRANYGTVCKRSISMRETAFLWLAFLHACTCVDRFPSDNTHRGKSATTRSVTTS